KGCGEGMPSTMNIQPAGRWHLLQDDESLWRLTHDDASGIDSGFCTVYYHGEWIQIRAHSIGENRSILDTLRMSWEPPVRSSL
ncbi:MAG TPA: hypothetical protein VE134_04345, partial [Methanomicrobiales archaeon]|nr:hypothetical protein [Methanomicrobiales archaeon]